MCGQVVWLESQATLSGGLLTIAYVVGLMFNEQPGGGGFLLMEN